MSKSPSLMAKRFRGFLPIVLDLETAGFNARTDALLEIAAVIVEMDEQGLLYRGACHAYHVKPFLGANLDREALAFNKIDPYHPFRFAIDEIEALDKICYFVQEKVQQYRCQRAVIVAHNAWFDLSFFNAAIARCQIKRNPFHSFTTFDTATLAGLAYGQTVLARAVQAAGISFDPEQAHSAIYDSEKTCDLFCQIINHWQKLGGWPPPK